MSERTALGDLDLTHEQFDAFAQLSEPDIDSVQQVIWRLACHAGAYMLVARGDLDSALVLTLSARERLP